MEPAAGLGGESLHASSSLKRCADHGSCVANVQASLDLGVHVSQLRDWVKKFFDDRPCFPESRQE